MLGGGGWGGAKEGLIQKKKGGEKQMGFFVIKQFIQRSEKRDENPFTSCGVVVKGGLLREKSHSLAHRLLTTKGQFQSLQ